MIRLHEITGQENLLQAFVARYDQAGGFPLDIEYARRCRAFAFMSAGGELYSAVPISILYEGRIVMPDRVLNKYVFLSQGKKGFVRGIVREAWRRTKKCLLGWWTSIGANARLTVIPSKGPFSPSRWRSS